MNRFETTITLEINPISAISFSDCLLRVEGVVYSIRGSGYFSGSGIST